MNKCALLMLNRLGILLKNILLILTAVTGKGRFKMCIICNKKDKGRFFLLKLQMC